MADTSASSPKTEPEHRTERPGEASLFSGLHVLTSVLLIIQVSASVGMPMGQAVINLLLAAAFAWLYFFGSNLWRGWPPLGRLGWVAVLTVLWLGMLQSGSIAFYLVLPLYFLYLIVVPGWTGIMFVVALTVVAVIAQIPGGLTVGGVMGPSVSALVVIAIDFAFRKLWQVSREREELITELMATRTQLAETEHAAGVVAERQRIAHEIHDTLAQGLSSIQMLLHAAERDLVATGLDEATARPVVDRIEMARTTAADNLGEARAMIAALQPAALDEGSLEAALRRVARSFAASAEITIDVESDGAEQELPMRVEATLLRIAQGALSNVVKHSKATAARVTLSYAPDEVRLDVVDNGRGFDVAAVTRRPAGLGHVGLDAMRRRAEEIGARVEIESAPGEGSAVTVAVPASTEQSGTELKYGGKATPKGGREHR